jgi:hypothetical protein
MARRRNDERGLARRAPTRAPLPLILVVCEGEVTERQYLGGFAQAQGAGTVRVQIVAPGGDPRMLVRRAAELRDEAAGRAKRERDENLAYDEVWCVFDVDEHARLEEARHLAREQNVRLAVSDPCFELWLILHFADQGAALDARRAREVLRRHIPEYRKHVRYAELAPGYVDAVRRAAMLEQRHSRAGVQGGNPSTDVHHLTERIRELGKDARLGRAR